MGNILIPAMGKPMAEVRSQILVVVKGATAPYLINLGDEVTTDGGQLVKYPDQVLEILSDTDRWLDLWVDSIDEQEQRTKIGVRLFGRHVIILTQAFIFPPDEQSVQA